MEYKAFFKSGQNLFKNFDVKYAVFEDKGSFFIESEICGGFFREISFLGNCSEEKATETVKLFAEKGVHPLHIEDIISDMRF